MKIAQISMYYSPVNGGQQYYVRDLKDTLTKAGHQVLIVQGNLPQFPEEGVIGVLDRSVISKVLSVLCHRIKMGTWVKYTLMLFFKIRLLSGYDVLICHYPLHYLALWWHPKVIVVSHGVDWPKDRHLFVDHLKTLAVKLMTLKKVKVVANDTEFLRQIGVNINPQERYFEEIKNNIWFIPNCVDTNFFRTAAKEKKSVILVPRNFRKARGIHLAIEAFNLVSKRHRDFSMVIAGAYNPNSEYYLYCLDLIRRYDLEGKVRILGSVSHSTMKKLYDSSKITLIPTLDFEGTSLSALESMAQRTPVISTNVGGLKDLPTVKSGPLAKSLASAIETMILHHIDEGEKQFLIVKRIFKFSAWKKTWLNVVES